MSGVYNIDDKKAEKRIIQLTEFLIELDSVCDILYNRLEYDGIYSSLMKLEDVRIMYYVELREHEEALNYKGNNDD